MTLTYTLQSKKNQDLLLKKINSLPGITCSIINDVLTITSNDTLSLNIVFELGVYIGLLQSY